MQPLTKRLNTLRPQIDAALLKLHIDEKQQHIAELEDALSQSEVWYNPTRAQSLSQQLAG